MNVINMRRWHSYIGLFIAPSVLFFALTGATQLFSLHEEHGDYKPPPIVEKLSSVHKDQVFALGGHHAQPAPEIGSGEPGVGSAPGSVDEDGDKHELPTLLLKSFFLVVALGLTLSATLGLLIGLTQTRSKRTAWIIVIAGTLLPVGLLVV
jgi:hypothetical protein